MRAFLFLMLASCTHDIAVVERVDVPNARDLDILYVLDNSSDRGSYDQMAAQLDVLQTRLGEIDGQVPNLHVGVVTTDLGSRGTQDLTPFPGVANCDGDGDAGQMMTLRGGGVPDGWFLEDNRGPNGTRVRNFESNDLVVELGVMTNPAAGVATTGCEFEQPLEAMRRALDPEANPGFLRPNAMLQVVFLTTEDDCSFTTGGLLDPGNGALGPLSSFRCTEQGVICDEDDDPRRAGVRTNCRPREGSRYMVDVAEYQAYLESLKPNRDDVIVSAVAGARSPFEVMDLGHPVLAPSCQGAGGAATPAVRIGSMVDSFGGVLVDGCTQDAAYQQLTTPIVNRQRACLASVKKADGEDCRVIETVAGVDTELARCADGGASPCWYTYADAASCPAGDNLGIAIRRGTTTAPLASRIEATCFVK
jgi:hypothetical protein